jgi:hypothetical protein
VEGKGTGHGTINGTMAFDRNDYGMNSGIPFIKIADRVEVAVDLRGDHTSGPPPLGLLSPTLSLDNLLSKFDYELVLCLVLSELRSNLVADF